MTIEARFQRTALAVLWSLPLTGLGQLYNGQPGRALSFFALGLVIELAVLTAVTSGLPFTMAGMMAILAAGVAWVLLRIIVLGDAAFNTRRADQPVLRAYNRWYVLLALALASLALGEARGLTLGGQRSIAAYRIPSTSMRPTIEPGDLMVAWRDAYRDRPPRRGDLVVFRLPAEDSENYVKRLVGLPGDRIRIAGGRLSVNGRTVERARIGKINGAVNSAADSEILYSEALSNGHRYRIVERSDTAPLDNTPVYRVPPAHYFVLGDNRDNSRDSRSPDVIGFVAAERIKDKPLYVLWSRTLARIGVRLR